MPSANVGRISAAPPDARRRTVAEEACGARLERVERVGRRGFAAARNDGGGSARASRRRLRPRPSASSARVAAVARGDGDARQMRQHAPVVISPKEDTSRPAVARGPGRPTRGAANAATDARIDDIRGRARAPAVMSTPARSRVRF